MINVSSVVEVLIHFAIIGFVGGLILLPRIQGSTREIKASGAFLSLGVISIILIVILSMLE